MPNPDWHTALEAELAAMRKLARILEPLNREARARVLAYLTDHADDIRDDFTAQETTHA